MILWISFVKTRTHAFNRQIPLRPSKLHPTRTLRQPISPQQILWFRFRRPVQLLISPSTHKTWARTPMLIGLQSPSCLQPPRILLPLARFPALSRQVPLFLLPAIPQVVAVLRAAVLRIMGRSVCHLLAIGFGAPLGSSLVFRFSIYNIYLLLLHC